MARFYHRPKLSQLQLYYCDHHHFPLPLGHKFPLEKYRLLREKVASDKRFCLSPAPFASREDILRIHSPDYVSSFLDGSIPPLVMRRIGFPWSPDLVNRTLASVGGTLRATQSALETGFGGTLAGGTHHAFRSEGAGFCVFNDLAISIAWARAERSIERAAIIDLDVHQGDGTAAIFAGDKNVFTLSLHGASNFPFRKQVSCLDLELPDQTGDQAYLEKLRRGLDSVWAFDPQLVFFQSGVDALHSDKLGRLALTAAGLHKRDQIVLEETHDRGVPLVVTLGGGYSNPIALTVEAHASTFTAAANIYVATDLVKPPE